MGKMLFNTLLLLLWFSLLLDPSSQNDIKVQFGVFQLYHGEMFTFFSTFEFDDSTEIDNDNPEGIPLVLGISIMPKKHDDMIMPTY